MENTSAQDDPRLENDLVTAVPTSGDKSRTNLTGSYVIIPKSQVASPFEMSMEEWDAMKEMMDIVKRHLDGKYHPDGYNVGWNVGRAAGQESPYAHLHIMPRFNDEPFAGKGIRYWLKQDENIRLSIQNDRTLND